MMKLQLVLFETNIFLNLCFYYLNIIMHSSTGYPTVCCMVLRQHPDQTLSKETSITWLMIYLNLPFLGLFFSNFYYIYYILCVYGGGRQALVHVWRAEHSFQEWIFFLHKVGPGDGTQIARLCNQCLDPSSHLAGQDVKNQ